MCFYSYWLFGFRDYTQTPWGRRRVKLYRAPPPSQYTQTPSSPGFLIQLYPRALVNSQRLHYYKRVNTHQGTQHKGKSRLLKTTNLSDRRVVGLESSPGRLETQDRGSKGTWGEERERSWEDHLMCGVHLAVWDWNRTTGKESKQAQTPSNFQPQRENVLQGKEM